MSLQETVPFGIAAKSSSEIVQGVRGVRAPKDHVPLIFKPEEKSSSIIKETRDRISLVSVVLDIAIFGILKISSYISKKAHKYSRNRIMSMKS